MDNITNIDDDNLGGLQQLRLAPVYFFSSVFTATFKAGFDWINVDCTKETGILSERRSDDVSGGYTDSAINANLPKIRPDINALLEQYSGKAVIVECLDNNGSNRRVGTSGRVIMLYQASTGADVSDMNGYQLQISGRQRKPSLFI